MKKNNNHSRPKNLRRTFLRLRSYFKPYWYLFLLVILRTIWTAIANLEGTRYAGDRTNYILNSQNVEASVRYATYFTRGTKLIILYLTGVACALIHNEIRVVLTQKILYKLRSQLRAKRQNLPISYFDTHTHGEIRSFFTNDVDSLLNCLNDSIANIILSATNRIGTIVSLFILNVRLTLIVLVFIVVRLVFRTINAKISRKYFIKTQQALSNVNSVVEEDISGTKVIKAFNHEEASYQKFSSANQEWKEASSQAFYHTQRNTPFFVSLSYLNFAVASVLGVIALCTGRFGSLNFGQLQSYLVLVRNVCRPFNYFTRHLNNILSARAGAERIFGFLDEKEEQETGKITLEKISDEEDFSKRYAWKKEDGSLIPLEGKIEFKNVCFSYVKGKPILQNISFECHRGKKRAFVGATGAGKTTIISLLARFYPIDSGEILYDGINIVDIELESLRRALSMVTQDTHLFTDTRENNIRYVRRHSTHEEVVNAAKKTQADSFIRRSPEGYDTMLYDDGGNLSEGQRQLLGLTRATLNQPPVLILDEATSNIDTRSELLIQQSLNELRKSRTTIRIAHRLSTIRDADEIIVLEHGVIQERGTQDELLALHKKYYDLYTGKVELS